jgi:hypothetical protein
MPSCGASKSGSYCSSVRASFPDLSIFAGYPGVLVAPSVSGTHPNGFWRIKRGSGVGNGGDGDMKRADEALQVWYVSGRDVSIAEKTRRILEWMRRYRRF